VVVVCVWSCKWGSRLGGKSLKLSHWGLVTGALLGMAAGGNGGRWYGGMYEAVVVPWCHVFTQMEMAGLGPKV
jgi:hypothetical protein